LKEKDNEEAQRAQRNAEPEFFASR